MTVILFISFVNVTIFLKGDLSDVFLPMASGMVCGDINGPASFFPYIYYSNPINDILGDTYKRSRYCVRSCPAFDATGTMPATIQVYPFGKTVTFNTTILSEDVCFGCDFGYDSSPVFGRICLPSSTALISLIPEDIKILSFLYRNVRTGLFSFENISSLLSVQPS
jgi:hypothetical protein